MALAKTVPEAKTTTTASPIGEIINMFNQTYETVHQSVLNVAGVKSDAEYWAKVQGVFQTFLNTVKSALDSLVEEVNFDRAKVSEKRLIDIFLKFYFYLIEFS